MNVTCNLRNAGSFLYHSLSVKRQIILYQNPFTGLYPETSRDKEVACVRSSVYANMSVWSLFQAYKSVGSM